MSKDTFVIVTFPLPEQIGERLCELFDTRLNHSANFSPAELYSALGHADVIVSTLTDKLTKEALSHASDRLKLIANFGSGVDHIDLEQTHRRSIVVTNTPSVLKEDTADMAMAMILALPRRLLEGANLLRQRSDLWQGWSPHWMLGKRVNNSRLGIIGMGQVGQALAQRAGAFGMQIAYHNRDRLPKPTEEMLRAKYYDNLDDMLPNIDILSVNCPYTESTHRLMDEKRLKLMPKGSYLVNTARAGIIDEDALLSVLSSDHLAGAALDVFESDSKLIGNDKALILPHMASATREARLEMGQRVIVNIKSFVDGHTPPDRVTLSML